MKKIFFSMLMMLAGSLAMTAEVDRTLIFTDADSNEVQDGSTFVVDTIVEDPYTGGEQMLVGLFIKNTTGSSVGCKMLLDLTQMPYGSLSCCFGLCKILDKPGNYESSKCSLGAGVALSVATEWFPGENKKDGVWEAVLQPCVLEASTNKVIGYGPKVTVKFVIGDTPKGDINGDDVVNVTDVTALINTILGTADYDSSLCDMNGDGVLNVTDVTALINTILGA